MKTKYYFLMLLSTFMWITANGQDFSFNRAPDDFGSPPEWNWAQQFGGSGPSYSYDATTDANGNIYITGTFSGALYLGPDTISSTGLWDAFIAKLTSAGDLTFLGDLLYYKT